MKMYISALLALTLVFTTVAAQDKKDKEKAPSAQEIFSEGMTKAREAKKQLFLVFGSPGCGWCVKLQNYHDIPEVSKILGKYFVIVKVDTVKNAGGQEMFLKYGKERGVPAFTIIDVEEKVVADSGDLGENIGFPMEPQEVEQYFKMLQKACPSMTRAEMDVLRTKLKEAAPKKND
jgi:thiol-disulfide isomerase/thioredoxin